VSYYPRFISLDLSIAEAECVLVFFAGTFGIPDGFSFCGFLITRLNRRDEIFNCCAL